MPIVALLIVINIGQRIRDGVESATDSKQSGRSGDGAPRQHPQRN
jgi:hypothetical protein